MFLIEIRKIALLYLCCCVIIFAESAKLHIQAYKVLEDITSIIACQEKSYASPMPFAVTALNGIIPMPFDRCFKSGNSHKSLQNFFQTMILPDKDNFARCGMKT